MVGARGFEPPTPRSRTECSTRLSHAPTKSSSILPHFRPAWGGAVRTRRPRPSAATAQRPARYHSRACRATLRPSTPCSSSASAAPPAGPTSVRSCGTSCGAGACRPRAWRRWRGTTSSSTACRRSPPSPAARPTGCASGWPRTDPACRCSWACATGTRSSRTPWPTWPRRASNARWASCWRPTTAIRAAGSTARTSIRRGARCGRRAWPTSRCCSRPAGTRTRASSKPTPGGSNPPAKTSPPTPRGPRGSSSRRTAFPPRWRRTAATRRSCARRRPWWRSVCGPATGPWSSRAAAGAPRIPGWGRTSAIICATPMPRGCGPR